MAKKKTTKKKRNEIRVSDIPDFIYNKVFKNADFNDRSASKEIVHHLKNTY